MPHLGIAVSSLAAIQLVDRTRAVVHGHIAVGLFAEAIPRIAGPEAIDPACMTNRVLGLAGDQLAIANQADRAVTVQGQPARRPWAADGSGMRRALRRAACPRPVRICRISREVATANLARMLRIRRPEVALMDGENLAVGSDDDRRRQSGKVETEGQLFVYIGPQFDRHERISSVLHDHRMRKRITLHAGAIGAPRPGKLDPQQAIRGPGFLEGATIIVSPGDRLGFRRQGGSQRSPAQRMARTIDTPGATRQWRGGSRIIVHLHL